jgi:hypothetical protein
MLLIAVGRARPPGGPQGRCHIVTCGRLGQAALPFQRPLSLADAGDGSASSPQAGVPPVGNLRLARTSRAYPGIGPPSPWLRQVNRISRIRRINRSDQSDPSDRLFSPLAFSPFDLLSGHKARRHRIAPPHRCPRRASARGYRRTAAQGALPRAATDAPPPKARFRARLRTHRPTAPQPAPPKLTRTSADSSGSSRVRSTESR